MELCLSLGEHGPAAEPLGFSSSSQKKHPDDQVIMTTAKTTELGFCMSLSIGPSSGTPSPGGAVHHVDVDADPQKNQSRSSCASKLYVPVQLDLLPHSPVALRSSSSSKGFPWPCPSDQNEAGGGGCSKEADALDVKRVEEVAAASSSATNSGASSFHMDVGLYSINNGSKGGGELNNYNIYKRGHSPEGDEGEVEGASNSRASDEDDIINGNTSRKKLRLSKEQSAFLEESFKEHHTLNPKQKLALAKQLNLRPRQVEVWFQNRRARTKLKQTEVDCEFLKRCCETLTEENRRLHKELQELRALKSSHHSNPFYMQSPATTLTMCPSCDRTTTSNANTNTNKSTTSRVPTNNDIHNIDSSVSTTKPQAAGFPLNRPRFYPFSQPQSHQSSAAS